MHRRSFLTGIATSLIAAPAIVEVMAEPATYRAAGHVSVEPPLIGPVEWQGYRAYAKGNKIWFEDVLYEVQ